MRKKSIKIPIYFGKLTFVITDDFKKVDKVFKTEIGNKNYDGVFFEMQDEYVIALKKTDISVIAHECVHAVNAIYLNCHIELDRVNDEPQAYLMGWIIGELDKFIKETK